MDGHTMAGEPVAEETLLDGGYRKYQGADIDVYYNKELCTHSGNCVRGNSAVFEVGRRPWILADYGEASQVAQVINTCPSGALKFIKKEQR